MKTIKREDINRIKMSTNPPPEIVKANMCVISEGYVYQYVGIGWVHERQATMDDYFTIPEITD